MKQRVTKFRKNGKKIVSVKEYKAPKMMTISVDRYNELTETKWSLDQALPSRAGDLPEKSFKDINPVAIKRTANILKLRNKIGDAVLLLLTSLTKSNYDQLFQSMHFDGEEGQIKMQEMMWNVIMEIIYNHEKAREYQDGSKIEVDRIERSVGKKVIKKTKHMKSYDYVIKSSDIQKVRGIDLKQAIPITAPKSMGTKRKR